MTPNYPPELHHLITQDIREIFGMTDYNPSMIDGGQYNIECPYCHNQIHEQETTCPYCDSQFLTFCPLCGNKEHGPLSQTFCTICNFSLRDSREENDLIWEKEELDHIVAKHKENML